MIDADTHVLETEETWDYLEADEQQFRPRPLDPKTPGPGPVGFWLVDGHVRPRGGGSKPNPVPPEAKFLTDVSARLRQMDEMGVDIQVIYPTFFNVPYTRRPEVEAALSRSYNRWMASKWAQSDNRLRWIVVPPAMTMDRALEELTFGKEHGACGVLLRAMEGERFLTERYFDPLYERAQALDLPICVHVGMGNMPVSEALRLENTDPEFWAFILPTVAVCNSLIVGDVPERFPRLRFAIVEVGAQWVPFVVHDAIRRTDRLEGRAIDSSPFRDKRIYVACRTDDDLAYVLRYTGPDNVITGSDYGHVDPASEIDYWRNLRAHGEVDPAVIDRILDANARVLYGIRER